jgi:hypothetical protein
MKQYYFSVEGEIERLYLKWLEEVLLVTAAVNANLYNAKGRFEK